MVGFLCLLVPLESFPLIALIDMFSPGLEEEANLYRGEARELRHRLNDLETRHDLLTQAGEVAVDVVRSEAPQLLHDRLRALPDQIREVVRAGARCGTADALAAADLHGNNGRIGALPVGWPAGTTPPERRLHALYFAPAADAIAAEIDFDALLQRDRDAGQDGM